MKWPEDWNPPYIIAWRLLWLLPMYAGRILFCGSVACSMGWRAGCEAWRDTR